jgi:catechol 2,3-dioxygenase-like lactoylglutathione lyase family enzyme
LKLVEGAITTYVKVLGLKLVERPITTYVKVLGLKLVEGTITTYVKVLGLKLVEGTITTYVKVLGLMLSVGAITTNVKVVDLKLVEGAITTYVKVLSLIYAWPASMLGFLIDNIYVFFGDQVFQQSVDIPRGTDCVPLLADLFLYSYEAEFVQKLLLDNNKKTIRVL